MNKLIVLQASLLILFCGAALSFTQQAVPAEAHTHMDRGIAAVEQATTDGDLQDAIREFKEATRLAPDWPDPYYNLGRVQEKLGLTEDAINSYGKYLALAPNASDADKVRQLMTKLQYKADKDAQLAKVYKMRVSNVSDWKSISTNGRIIISPMQDWGLVNGKMVAYDSTKQHYNDDQTKSLVPDWYPITVNGRFYEYRFTYYMCDLGVARDFGAPPYCPFDASVKGEVISLDPPQIKEVVTVTANWGSSPNPGGWPTGVFEVVWKIVPKDASINADNSGNTPLGWAIIRGHKEEVESLIARGADVNAKNKGGDTPLKLAATSGQKEVVELLIAKGADINAKDNNGDTTLANAVKYDKREMAELLIAKGADVNAKNNDGYTPLHNAVSRNNKEMAELLIANGEDINAKDNTGDTPLHMAAMRGNREVAELLIAKGADINAKDNDGNAPLHQAAGFDRVEVAELLIAKGADINAKNNYGNTPLQWAEMINHKDVADLLSKHGAR